jgi:hypothetical protein
MITFIVLVLLFLHFLFSLATYKPPEKEKGDTDVPETDESEDS